MIVLEPYQVETFIAKPLNVFGIRLEWFIAIVGVIGCFVLFAVWQWWQNKKRRENFLEAQNSVLIEFLPDDGSIPVDRAICSVHKGIAKKIEI